MEDHPTIARIREVRRQISQRFGHDPKRLVEYYMELQKQHQDRLIQPPKREEMPERA